jgi:hypothetical protein
MCPINTWVDASLNAGSNCGAPLGPRSLVYRVRGLYFGSRTVGLGRALGTTGGGRPIIGISLHTAMESLVSGTGVDGASIGTWMGA